MPVFRRRAHYRVDDRTGRRILVRAHTVSTDGTGGEIDEDHAARLRAQANLLADYLGPQDPDPERRSLTDMVEGFTVEATRLTATGNTPGRWWDAQDTLIDGDDAANVVQMPERYSPSSATTNRRTHRIQYQFGDTKVRMPSRAAIGRFMNDNPTMTEFEIPVEGLTGNRRGMGFIRMRRDATTGLWHAVGGSGGFAGSSEFAQATRQNLDGVANRRRGRPSRAQARRAVQGAQAALRVNPESTVNTYGYNPSAAVPGDQVFIEGETPATVVAVGTGEGPVGWAGRVLVQTSTDTDPFPISGDALAAVHNSSRPTEIPDHTPEPTGAGDGVEGGDGGGVTHCPNCGQFTGDTRGHLCPTQWTRDTGSEVRLAYDPDTASMTIHDDEGVHRVEVTRDMYRAISEAGPAAQDVLSHLINTPNPTLDSNEQIRMRLPVGEGPVQAAGYDPDTGRLAVEMMNNARLTYTDVPPEIWDQWRNSETPARFWAEHIRGRYQTQPAATIHYRGTIVQPDPDRAPQPNDVLAACSTGSRLIVHTRHNSRHPETGRPTGSLSYELDEVGRDVVARFLTSDNPTEVYETEILGRAQASTTAGLHYRCRCGESDPTHTCTRGRGAFSHTGRTISPRVRAVYNTQRQIVTGRHTGTGPETRFEIRGITQAEFNRFLVAPETTLAIWQTGRRLTTPGEHPAPTTLHYRGLERVRLGTHTSNFVEQYELLEMPRRTPIQAAIRNSPDGFVHVPVRGHLRIPNDETGEIVQTRFEGHVRVERVRGRGFVVTDDGHLHTDAPEAVIETIAATLNGRRARTSFEEAREAALSSSALLAGRAEQARAAAEAERVRREEQAQQERERVQRERAARAEAIAAARAQSEAAAAALMARYGAAPTTTWGTSPDRFQEVYTQARAKAAAGENPIPYLRENALDGLADRSTGRGFGIELEFNFRPGVNSAAARRAILNEMRNEGLLSDQHPRDRWLGYMEQRRHGTSHWKCTDDGTVAGEIVSPILFDEPETWDQIEKVCEIVRRHGGIASTGQVGQHVHVSCGDYDETPENHARLLKNVNAAGDDLYRVATNRERGTHRGTRWCSPNRPLPVEGFNRVEEVRRGNVGHGLGVNFESVNGEEGDHVEFRMFDGSLDPATIQSQVKFSVGLVAASLAGREIPAEAARPVGTALASNPGRDRLTGEQWDSRTEGFRKVLDTLFTREIDKAQLASVWATSRWASPRH